MLNRVTARGLLGKEEHESQTDRKRENRQERNKDCQGRQDKKERKETVLDQHFEGVLMSNS